MLAKITRGKYDSKYCHQKEGVAHITHHAHITLLHPKFNFLEGVATPNNDFKKKKNLLKIMWYFFY